MARITCELPGGENCFSEDGELQGFRITDKPQQQRSEEKGLGRAARGQVETIVNEGRGGHHCAPPVQKCQLRKHLCTRDSLPNGNKHNNKSDPAASGGEGNQKGPVHRNATTGAVALFETAARNYKTQKT